MINATIIQNVSSYIVIVGIGVFIGIVWMIQRAKSCASALIDALLILVVGVLVVFFLLIINVYF